jgi:hypothetical protein
MPEAQAELSIRGLQEAQRLNARIIAYTKPNGPLSAVVKNATARLHRYLVGITHVITGAYRASQRMEFADQRGRLYVDPGAVNPRTNQRPEEYAVYEENRGGEHAAYRRTADEEGPKVQADAIDTIARGMLYG